MPQALTFQLRKTNTLSKSTPRRPTRSKQASGTNPHLCLEYLGLPHYLNSQLGPKPNSWYQTQTPN